MEAQRIHARDHERLEIRTLHPAILQLLHGVVHGLVELHELVGALAARLERLRQFGCQKLVAALEHRMIRTAGEAAVLLVTETERDERCFLELDRELPLRAIVERRERLGEPHDLERPLAQVVRLLGVEQQDAMRHLGLGHDEGHDRPRAKRAHRTEPVVAVRRPIDAAAGGHSDDGIEEAVELIDRTGKSGDVCLGEIALKGSRLDAVEGERGEDLPVAAEWIAIDREHGATIVGDRARERLDRGRRRGAGETPRLETARCSRNFGLLLFLGALGGGHAGR